jgi:hypothetical protein
MNTKEVKLTYSVSRKTYYQSKCQDQSIPVNINSEAIMCPQIKRKSMILTGQYTEAFSIRTRALSTIVKETLKPRMTKQLKYL